ncbi:DUF3368 domain-containing protein [Clostridium grantii]|uniref:Predicted nucleic acid-binding protein, contains PIN domain n=1 Tax=Clostridium grantii DSM 8605 TaxID=1121316 RepID=A0A1M5VW84_9CLOT|nr:DUF3368 domain-containing protein [Clostridium grantii]SHH79471.1 Predicted nucleic acid-binding protein, contains PIN domain [Clostridium grantii DSM 8605]
MHKVVVNSTPLISLSIINKLEVLKELYGRVYVPYGVYEEVCLEGEARIGADFLRNNNFLIVEEIKNEDARKFFQTSLHKGEVEVMILADELKADLCIIEDLLARKYAKHLGFTITGTLGILIKAKEMGVINSVKPLMDELIKNNIYINSSLYSKILELTNEN